MKFFIVIVAMLICSSTVFADSQCKTSAGRAALSVEYVQSNGPVPACGAECSQDFILTQVCALNAKPNCYTEEGRALKIKAFVKAGNPVPSCGPECAKKYILSKVCPQAATQTDHSKNDCSPQGIKLGHCVDG